MYERFIGVEQPVAPGQQIPFKPAFQGVFTEHFHDAPIGGQEAAIGILFNMVGQPGFAGYFISRLKTVRGVFIGAEQAEIVRVVLDDVANENPRRTGG